MRPHKLPDAPRIALLDWGPKPGKPTSASRFNR